MGRRKTTRIGRRQAARKGLPYVPLHNPKPTSENGHKANEKNKLKKR